MTLDWNMSDLSWRHFLDAAEEEAESGKLTVERARELIRLIVATARLRTVAWAVREELLAGTIRTLMAMRGISGMN